MGWGCDVIAEAAAAAIGDAAAANSGVAGTETVGSAIMRASAGSEATRSQPYG